MQLKLILLAFLVNSSSEAFDVKSGSIDLALSKSLNETSLGSSKEDLFSKFKNIERIEQDQNSNQIIELEKIKNLETADIENKIKKINNALADIEEKIKNSENILKLYSAKIEGIYSIPLIEISQKLTYDHLITAEENFLKYEKALNDFLILYGLLNKIQPKIYTLIDTQHKLEENFSVFFEVNKRINETNQQKQKVNERFIFLKEQIGVLNFKDISYFIEQSKQDNIFDTNDNLTSAIKKTIEYIQSAYAQINEEKEKLKEKTLFGDILCDANSYKSSYRGHCLNIFSIQNKKQIQAFLDTLSLEKWKELSVKFQKNDIYSQFLSRGMDKDTALKETLYALSQESSLYQDFERSWKISDFYRWVYFVLKSNLDKEESTATNFSWAILETASSNQIEESNQIHSLIILFVLEELDNNEQKSEIAKNLTQISEKYFLSLNAIQSFLKMYAALIEIELEQTELSCFTNYIEITEDRKECLQKVLKLIANKNQKQKELESLYDKYLTQIIFNGPIVIDNLKAQRDQLYEILENISVSPRN